jgi:hypothetical protein
VRTTPIVARVPTYETTADGRQRCPLHDEKFATGDCSRCLAIRTAASINVSSAVDSTALDAEMIKDCDEDLAFARFLHDRAEKRIRDGNPNDWNAAAKLIAEGTKLKYRALDQKDKLSGRAHSRYLVEHEKEIKGLTKRKGN